jgi:ParB family chromosome partitioning protein
MATGVGISMPVSKRLPLDWVTPDPGNPRTHFDEAEMAELAASIEARGFM